MAKDLTAALHALTEQARGQTSRDDVALPAGRPVSAIPSRSGTAVPGGGTSGAIASPLTETDYADRTFWTTQNMTSTDGLFTLKIKPIKSVKFNDANLNEVVMNYQAPP